MNQAIFRKLLKISSVTFKIIITKNWNVVFLIDCPLPSIFWYFYLTVQEAGITTRELDTSTKRET